MADSINVNDLILEVNDVLRDHLVTAQGGATLVYGRNYPDWCWELNARFLQSGNFGPQLRVNMTINVQHPLEAGLQLRLIAHERQSEHFWGSALFVPGLTLKKESDYAQWFTVLTLPSPDTKRLFRIQLQRDNT